MKILGFAGSNSLDSINKMLVTYAVSLFETETAEIVDLNEFETHLFRMDREKINGIPEKIKTFAEKISAADLIVVSLAENNGSYNAAFKNIYDWLSRIPNRSVFDSKPVLLMGTSPGRRGAQSVLEAAKERFPRDGAEIKGVFSLPLFETNFDQTKKRITNAEKDMELKALINPIKNHYNAT